VKVLQVIHGYPMRYNAGSEVYTQTLCHGLVANGHEVQVFTREEDPFAPDFALRDEVDRDEPRIKLHIVNNPRNRDRYRQDEIDAQFAAVLDAFQPDIVHIGHLNHLSTSLCQKAAARNIPIVYTLHDYWVMCPRGQFMQMHPEDPQNLWPACDGQEDGKCADRCYARYYSGAGDELAADRAYWTDWVGRRMRHVREMTELVDLFIAPAQYLLHRYRDEFHLPAAKLVYLDYGFDHTRLAGRARTPGEPFTFGYIGTHIPAKGIHQLIDAFGRLRGDVHLRIYGRPRGQETASLKALADSLPGELSQRVVWLPEYRNQEIVADVFNRVDAIVVPSIWVENSPLVIHEALQARLPVITADTGGMAEYVVHEKNGLLFRHRDPLDLARQMQQLAQDPELARRLGNRGYVQAADGNIPDVQSHVVQVERLYAKVLSRRETAQVTHRTGPWRITFDTNPDTCNLHCVMCEEHSPHSQLQIERKAKGKPRRIMPIELLRRTIEEAVPHGLREVIPSTMGEPLLYEHFDEILGLCRQHGVKLNLTTNGTFPKGGARAWAEKIVPVTSDVKFSWNGATAATHEAIMVGAKWAEVVENLRTFIEVRDAHATAGGNRCRVTLQLTFLESNVAELADIVRFAIGLGVDRIKGHHLWAHFAEIADLSMRRSPEAIARWNVAVRQAREVAATHPLENGREILLENIFELDPNAPADLAPGGACPFLGQEAWVSAEGRFDPCCAPDAQRRTLGEFGNLHQQSFMDVWHGDRYGSLATTYRNRDLCLGCNMRKPTAVQP
jgi:glycosyltransferase involved in cell wall biosynthesis/MoaA/NifB/PqqE/SkfB family radical SAM enzyme